MVEGTSVPLGTNSLGIVIVPLRPSRLRTDHSLIPDEQGQRTGKSARRGLDDLQKPAWRGNAPPRHPPMQDMAIMCDTTTEDFYF